MADHRRKRDQQRVADDGGEGNHERETRGRKEHMQAKPWQPHRVRRSDYTSGSKNSGQISEAMRRARVWSSSSTMMRRGKAEP